MNKRIFLVTILMLNSACTKLTAQKATDPVDESFFVRGDGSLNPASDKLSSNCFGDSDFDACIFEKNPVAQEQVAPSDLNSARKFGVKVRGLNRTGYLENSWLQVYGVNSPRFSLSQRGALKNPSGSGSDLEQFSAYYWGNRALEFLDYRMGRERLPITGLKIYADDAFTGYSSANNSIHLEKKPGQLAKALSGEIVIQLIGQVIADNLSGKKLLLRDLSKHNSCALDPKGCCTSELGCAQAIANGFGEYVAAMAFPLSAKVGESVGAGVDGSGGHIAGQSVCGMNRSLAVLAMKTKTEVFNACNGRAVLLGAWYASLWWKLRAQLDAGESGAAVDVDKMFFDHVKGLSSVSTFTEAKAEALRLAADYKAGKYLAAFTSAFSVL